MECGVRLRDCGRSVSVLWRLKGVEECEPCSFITSPEFETRDDMVDGRERWQLVCWPRGRLDMTGGTSVGASSLEHLSFVLHFLGDEERQMTAACRITLLDRANKEALSVGMSERRGTCWIWERLLSRKELLARKADLLPGSLLTVLCNISIIHDDRARLSRRETLLKSRFVNDLNYFFLNSELSDVDILVGEKLFPAHKLVLAARSPVFRAMFAHDMKESNERSIRISDLEEEVVEELMAFMYTGTAPKLAELADRLLAAADKYQMDTLKDLCELQLMETISTDNICATLSLAAQYSLPELKSACMEFLAFKMERVLQTGGFKELIASRPELTTEAFQYYIEDCKDRSVHYVFPKES